MKQRVMTYTIALLLVVFGSLAVVAQTEPAADLPTPQELQQRRDEAKDQVHTQIDAAKQARIRAACQRALDLLQAISNRATTYKDNHAQAYDAWRQKLDAFVERLSNNSDVDTTTLTSNLTTLDGLVTEFRAAFADYEAAFTTLLAVDCTSDAQAFHDALEDTRALRTAVVDAAKAVRDFINTTIKADLQDIRTQLGGSTNDGTSNTTDTSGTDRANTDSQSQSTDNTLNVQGN